MCAGECRRGHKNIVELGICFLFGGGQGGATNRKIKWLEEFENTLMFKNGCHVLFDHCCLCFCFLHLLLFSTAAFFGFLKMEAPGRIPVKAIEKKPQPPPEPFRMQMVLMRRMPLQKLEQKAIYLSKSET